MNARRYMFVVLRYSFHVRAVLQEGWVPLVPFTFWT